MSYLSPPTHGKVATAMSDEDLEVGAQAQLLRDGGAAWNAIGIEMGCSSDTARRLAGAYVTHADQQARKDQLSLF